MISQHDLSSTLFASDCKGIISYQAITDFMEETIGFKARFLSMMLRLVTLGLIAVALFISTDGVFIALLLFVLVVPFEKMFPRHKGQKVRRLVLIPILATPWFLL